MRTCHKGRTFIHWFMKWTNYMWDKLTVEEVEHLHLARKRETNQCVCKRVCAHIVKWNPVLASSLSYRDPFQVHCIVTLIYVAPHLRLLTMSTPWKIYAAVHIMCDDINALMNAFSSISLNKMTPIQPRAAAISQTLGMPGMLIGLALAFHPGLLPV